MNTFKKFGEWLRYCFSFLNYYENHFFRGRIAIYLLGLNAKAMLTILMLRKRKKMKWIDEQCVLDEKKRDVHFVTNVLRLLIFTVFRSASTRRLFLFSTIETRLLNCALNWSSWSHMHSFAKVTLSDLQLTQEQYGQAEGCVEGPWIYAMANCARPRLGSAPKFARCVAQFYERMRLLLVFKSGVEMRRIYKQICLLKPLARATLSGKCGLLYDRAYFWISGSSSDRISCLNVRAGWKRVWKLRKTFSNVFAVLAK